MARIYEYSSTQVNLPEPLAKKVVQWGRDNIFDIDLYRDPDDPSFGRESEPHITILYGIYETNAQKMRYVISNEKPFNIILGKIGIFHNDNFDVLKIEVDCDTLHELNSLMKDKFDHRNVFPVYTPHVTIAYLKKGRGKQFEGIDTFEDQHFTAKQIVYSGKDGTKCMLTLRGRTK